MELIKLTLYRSFQDRVFAKANLVRFKRLWPFLNLRNWYKYRMMIQWLFRKLKIGSWSGITCKCFKMRWYLLLNGCITIEDNWINWRAAYYYLEKSIIQIYRNICKFCKYGPCLKVKGWGEKLDDSFRLLLSPFLTNRIRANYSIIIMKVQYHSTECKWL